MATAKKQPAEGAASGAQTAGAESALRRRLMEGLEIAVKLTAPAAVIMVAVMGHSLQGSLTTSQMLAQREQSDTTIRAEMFKSISDRLFGAKSGAPLSAGEKAVFTELLALNFHEHIELKPLLLEVDQALSDTAKRHPGARAELEAKRLELQSIARRVRQRQTASLLRDSAPLAATPAQAGLSVPARVPDTGARLQLFSVRLKGYLPRLRGAMRSACEVDKEEGPTVCVREPMFTVSPDGRSRLAITVDGANQKRQSLQVSVKHSPLQPGDSVPQSGEYPSDAPECQSDLGDSDKEAALASDGSGGMQFDATWFDFPLTDSTLLANGSRYAIFIEGLCFDEPNSQQTVKLGLLWFPKDYFPARERPTNFRELRRKLGLELEG